MVQEHNQDLYSREFGWTVTLCSLLDYCYVYYRFSCFSWTGRGLWLLMDIYGFHAIRHISLKNQFHSQENIVFIKTGFASCRQLCYYVHLCARLSLILFWFFIGYIKCSFKSAGRCWLRTQNGGSRENLPILPSGWL